MSRIGSYIARTGMDGKRKLAGRTAPAIALVALLAAVGAGRDANATPTLFTNETSWLSATSSASISLGLESFEGAGILTNQPSINFGTVTVSYPGTGGVSTEMGTTATPSDGSFTIWYESNGSDAITFSFASPINAFGIDIFDPLDSGGSLTLMVSSETGGPFTVVSGALSNMTQVFAGLLDPTTTFSEVRFVSNGVNDVVWFDRLHFGTVREPTQVAEPGTLAMLGFGFAALGFVGWRRQRLAPRAVISS